MSPDPADPAAGPPPIDLRIVVDGASTAGKTTTARSLGARLGRPVTTPEEHDGRTLLFDWLDHEGGRSDGRAIRTQLVAVPGHLLHLRARLLMTADVVLFVADTSASGMRASEIALAQVRTLLDAYDGVRPGLVIQANKRDAPDALPMDVVMERLTAEGDDLVIETVATTGEGVRQSYVYAVRLGLQHARAVDGPRIAERQSTADALLAELDQDPRPIAEVSAGPDDPDPEREPAPAVRRALPAIAGPPQEPATATAVEPERKVEAEPGAETQAEVMVDPKPEPAMAVEPAPEPEAEPEPEAQLAAVVEPEPDREPEHGPELAPVGAGPVSGDDRPAHDHPRAWRRWFDG